MVDMPPAPARSAFKSFTFLVLVLDRQADQSRYLESLHYRDSGGKPSNLVNLAAWRGKLGRWFEHADAR